MDTDNTHYWTYEEWAKLIEESEERLKEGRRKAMEEQQRQWEEQRTWDPDEIPF